MTPPTRLADPAALAARIRRLSAEPPPTSKRGRVLIGITGAPGAGKSSLAAGVVAACGPFAVHVGMDGFHLAQVVLDELGLADVKGAPETFDAAGYLALLERLGREPDGSVVYAPEFRRSIEEPIAGAVPVPATTRVIITEGNYLLLDTPPWDRLRALLTEVWFLDTPEPLRIDRLVQRHIEFGRTPSAARERAVSGSDGRNADLVLATRGRADLILRP
jgi:pantothenate kinase